MPDAFQPIAFMVMPFRTKEVTNAKPGAPTELDCDRLWDAAFRPALEDLGYLPVRADLEAGTVIVKEMLNRLRHADLVLCDVSLPNGNVYYEVGVRHVAREKGCVLIAAAWFQPLFDVDGVRALTYPLADGSVPDDQAQRIRELLVEKLPAYATATTPYHVLVDETPEQAFEIEARRLSAFQTELSKARLLPPGDARGAAVRDLVESQAAVAGIRPSVAVELLALIRDTQDWSAVRAFVESLPPQAREVEVVQEQYFLALSELGRVEEAVAGVEGLVGRFGPTPERLGLLGGRHKRLYRRARAEREERGEERPSLDERKHLQRAIEHYERGMNLDLNAYYCASNLALLYHARGKKGDVERAGAVDALVVLACRRAEELSSHDEWLHATLFGAGFRAGDVEALEDLMLAVESGVPWRLETTLKDAADGIAVAPEAQRAELRALLARLSEALEPRTPLPPTGDPETP